MATLDEEGARVFATTMWEVWKERNKTVFEHRMFQPASVIQRVNACLRVESIITDGPRRIVGNVIQEKYEFSEDGWQVVVDASWEVSGKAGGAYLVYNKGELHSMGLHHFSVQDPFHAEATTLKEAMLYFYEDMNVPVETKVHFFSDCSNLIMAIDQPDVSDLPSWRSMATIRDLINLIEKGEGNGKVQHVRREAVHQAHRMANMARKNEINYKGRPNMLLQQQGRLTAFLDEQFFRRMQEAPT